MDSKLLTACWMLEGDPQGMKCQSMQIKARPEESIMFPHSVIDVTDERVGDVAKMTPDLV